MHPTEFWWLCEANKPDPVYRGKKSAIRGSEVESIVADLKAKGMSPQWRTQ